MASSSSDVSAASVYTLSDYFRDHRTDKKTQDKVLHKINLAVRILNSDREMVNSCTPDSVSKEHGYCRKLHLKKLTGKSRADIPYPLIKIGDRQFVVLKKGKFTLRIKFWRKASYQFQLKGGYKTVFPAIELGSSANPLEMRLFAWAKMTDDSTSKAASSVRDENEQQVKSLSKIELSFDREVSFLTQFRGPQTVDLVDTLKFIGKNDLTRMGMLMEWCPRTLSDKIRSASTPLSDQEKFQYAKSLIEMLLMLKQEGIYFRDLKGSNLLIDAAGHLKLADFGLAVPVKEAYKKFSGTFNHYAPEYIKGNSLIDKAYKQWKTAKTEEEKESFRREIQSLIDRCATVQGDVWAAGIILCQLFYGKNLIIERIRKKHSALGGVTPEDLFENWLKFHQDVIQAQINKIFSDNPPPNTIRGILKGMLTIDPEKRLTCEEVKAALNKVVDIRY